MGSDLGTHSTSGCCRGVRTSRQHRQRHIAPDGEMVDEREREDRPIVGTVEQGGALASVPADRGARVCEVLEDRQDPGLTAAWRCCQWRSLAAGSISSATTRSATVAAIAEYRPGVRTDVPDHRRRRGREQLGDERVLRGRTRVVIRGATPYSAHSVPSGFQTSPSTTRTQAVQQGRLARWAHWFCGGLGNRLGPVCVAPLRPGMQVDVASQPERQTGSRREKRRREIERDAVEVAAKQAARGGCRGAP